MLTEMMADTCVHWDTLPKHGPVNSKKYEAVLSVFYRNWRIGFNNAEKFTDFIDLPVTPFSIDINALPANFQMK